jgi:hypothetical protein
VAVAAGALGAVHQGAWVEVDGLPALPAAKDKFAQLVAL